MINKLIIVLLLLYWPGRPAAGAGNEKLIPVSAAIQVCSTISDGNLSIEKIVATARRNNYQVVVLTERDFLKWEYGLWPWRNLIKKTEEMHSLGTYGVQNYLKRVAEIQLKNPDMVIIPGVEAAPFYYWAGNPFWGDFKIADWHEHLLVIGLDRVSDFEHIPSLANKKALLMPRRWSDLSGLWPLLLLLAGIFCWRKRKYNYHDANNRPLGPYALFWHIIGLILIVFSLAALANNFPFRRYAFDQYHGDLGSQPYQYLVDYAGSRGGLTFWAHPEAQNIEKRGRITIETGDHSGKLLTVKNFTGFAVFYEGFKKVGCIGGLWDEILREYCSGTRAAPVWAITALAYDQTDSLDSRMADQETVLLVPRLGRVEVLAALKRGSGYALRGSRNLRLDYFAVSNGDSSFTANMGEEVMVQGSPVIKISGSTLDGDGIQVEIKVIRNGEVIKTFATKAPFMINYTDHESRDGQMNYYRLEILSRQTLIVSNPVFVKHN